MPEGHGDAHQSDECVHIDGLLRGISVLGGMVFKADKAI